ncbi:hypothetical protein KGM_200277 [Danaus plexippus plexippus]|uniref:Uncharacterized protein n=1 Tax=Danaus plexippus plexippus TaxID=278856 RepID=A0A212FIJ0_DANPL|nr:hypothetical protein KGM_200277 [Danaus plexippus plexippus]
MEKPDNDGYVHIKWPSKTIPHGGVFHTRSVETNKTQQEFLKVLLEESKLSIAQRQKSLYNLRQPEIKKEKQRIIQEPLIRPRTSRRRSLSAIRESGALDVDDFRPLKRGEDREKLKNILINKMAYGDTEQKPPTPPRIPKPKLEFPTKKEQWNELITQIRERAEWLAEMEDLGQGAIHRDLIKDQIAERMRALDALGIDSQCSSARSTASGFSVLPSERSIHSNTSSISKKNVQHKTSDRNKKKLNQKAFRKQEENVSAYGKLSPLQYSPRRRV